MSKLLEIQHRLKAPKGQYNSFGKYKYRSCEDILEAVKELLGDQSCILNISDELVLIGDRYYVKATATITNSEGKSVSTTAFAREPIDKKGMDESQITGMASSYARKYALNGLFDIDDTKDSDSTNDGGKGEKEEPKGQKEEVKEPKGLQEALKVEYEGRTLDEIVKTDKDLANKLLNEGEDHIREALQVILKAMKARAKK